MARTIYELPPVPSKYAEREDDPTILIEGPRGFCRFCGSPHEGTLSYAMAHRRRCAGVVSYYRMIAVGVSKTAALKAATVLHRDLTPRDGADTTEEWFARDWLSAENMKAEKRKHVRRNGGVECDMTEGPCACGAWH